jgi:hypothetical protein
MKKYIAITMILSLLGLLPLTAAGTTTSTTTVKRTAATNQRRHHIHQTKTATSTTTMTPAPVGTPRATIVHPADNPPDVWAAESDSFQ